MKPLTLPILVALAAFLPNICAAPTAEPAPVLEAEPLPAPNTFEDLLTPVWLDERDDSKFINGTTLSKRANGAFTAYYGNYCDGGAGTRQYFSSQYCAKTIDRHSFRIEGCTAKIGYSDDYSCRFIYSTSINGAGCYNVNTGRTWGSSTFQCN